VPASGWRHSLKHKITLGTLAIFIASIWGLSYYASRMLRSDMERLLADQQYSAASFVATAINDELETRIRALELIAKAITPSMLNNPQAIQSFLTQRFVLHQHFNAGVFILSRDGVAIADVSDVAGRIGTSYADYDAVRLALTEGKSSVGQPKIGRKLPKPVFTMVAPIHDADGKVIGTLAGTTNLAKPNFLDKVTQHQYGKSGGYLVIAPRHNVFVTATDKRHMMAQLPAPGSDPQHDRFMRGIEGSAVTVSSQGVEELSSVKRIPVADWFTVAILPTEEAFAPIRGMQERIMLAALALTLVVGAGSLWWLRRQFEPLQAAVDKLAEISDTSKQPPPLPVMKPDEIGQLVGAFNRLLENLGRSEERYRNLFELESDAIFLIDNQSGQILEANHAASLLYGYSREEFLGKKNTDLSAEPEETQRATHSPTPGIDAIVTIPLRWHREKNGLEFPVEITARFFIWDERPVHVAAIRDITERRQAEQRLQELNNNLHKLVTEAVNKNMEQERMLIQQSRLAAMGEMIGNIAHQWRQPINALTLLLANIKDAYEFNELDQDYLDKTVRKGQSVIQRMSTTIDDFRNFFKPNKEKLHFAVWDATEEAIKLIAQSFANTDIEIILDRDNEPCSAFGYPNEFSQVVLNLLANAKDAIVAKKTTGKVRIHVGREGNTATISIQDNGGGIPEEYLGKVFDPYFTTKESGTGIGLYMSKMIMRNMDGDIAISNVEDGALARITLPLATLP